MSDLYSTELLALASTLPQPAALPHVSGQGARRSPTCGSRVDTAVMLADGRVAALSQDVRACLLGQAAASQLARVAIGMDEAEVQDLQRAMVAMLAGGIAPAGFTALAGATTVPARHASVLLPFDALLAAMEKSRHP